VNLNTNKIELIRYKNVLDTIDISDVIADIKKNHTEYQTTKNIPYYARSGKDYDIKIVIQSYNLYI
jgi:hypothetical protein